MEAFLAAYRDSSMFLRSNIRHSGLTYRPKPFHAVYVGVFREERLTGVVAQAWNGMILMQAPDGINELVCECVRLSGRPVTGLTGPLEQVKLAQHSV